MLPDYSVLMSVYYKEKAEYLKQAIDSMLSQTVITNDFVLICDGPLTQELDDVVEAYDRANPGLFHIVRLPQNKGLGNALNIGVQECTNELIARMDSDDIALPYRCELQLIKFVENPELALCSGTIAEFETNPLEISGIRYVPITHKEIIKFAQKRNPFNHMAVMYRKDSVNAVGNYININLAEDYYLWIRMLQKGFIAINLEQILVYARVGNGMYSRRGGWSYARSTLIFQTKIWRLGFISFRRLLINSVIRCCVIMSPAKIRKNIYLRQLHKI